MGAWVNNGEGSGEREKNFQILEFQRLVRYLRLLYFDGYLFLCDTSYYCCRLIRPRILFLIFYTAVTCIATSDPATCRSM